MSSSAILLHMARWEPDAEDRLRDAALELFTQRGFDDVTVSEIAERAGLTRRSFFRYFTDKREVLFAGSDLLVAELERRMGRAGPEEAAAEALRVLTDAGTLLFDDRDAQQRRQRIIVSSPELQERDRTKTALIASAIARSLSDKGFDASEAALIGTLCGDIFRAAYDRALRDPNGLDFAEHMNHTAQATRTFFATIPNAFSAPHHN